LYHAFRFPYFRHERIYRSVAVGPSPVAGTSRIAANRPRRDAGATGHNARERGTGERRDAGAEMAACGHACRIAARRARYRSEPLITRPAATILVTGSSNGEADAAEPFEPIELEKRALLTMQGGWKMSQLQAEQPATRNLRQFQGGQFGGILWMLRPLLGGTMPSVAGHVRP